MLKISELTVILALLALAVFVSGCYTIVGYPPEAMEGVMVEESTEEPVYMDYGYYRSYPYSYYRDYYDPYYGLLSPYYYHDYYYDDYWGYSRLYYGNHYYGYSGYDGYRAPEKKPEVKYRSSSRIQRYTEPGSERKVRAQRYEEKEQSSREIRSKSRAENVIRRAVRKSRSSTSTSKRRSVKREDQDEKER